MGTGSGPAPWAGLEHVDAVSVGRVFLEYGPDPVFGMQDGVFVWVSGPVEELLGWSPGELIGMDGATVLHPSDEAEMQALALAIMEDGKASAVVRVRSRRGDFAWIEVSAQLIPSEHDSIQVIGTLHSAQRFAEAREGLVRNEERFRLAMENAPAGMAVVAPDGAFVLVNDALCSLLDRPRGELLTMRWQEVTHPDDLLNEVDLDGQVHSGHIDRYRLRKRYLRPDGQVVWADVSVGSVRDLDGALEYHVKSIVDVTSRVATEHELARVSRQYRVLAENVADVAYLFGPDGIATWVSPNVEAALGWSASELVGTPLFDLLHPDDQAWVRGLRARAMSGVDPEVPDEGWVVRMRRKDGSYLWMSQRTRVVHDDTGGVRELVGSLRDVDALVQARQQAESASSFMHAAMDAQSDPLVILRTLHEPGTDVGDCVVVEANQAAVRELGSSTAVIGERWSTCTQGLTYLPTVADVLTDLRRDGTYSRDEIEVVTSEGTTRFVDVRAALIDSDNLTLTWRDVTARRDAAAVTAASELRYRLLAENVSDVVIHVVGTTIAWASPSVTPVFGGAPQDWEGREATDFVHPDDLSRYLEGLTSLASAAFVRRRIRVRDFAGTYHWVDANARQFREADTTVNGFIASLRIVDELVAAEAELEHSARYDSLTGLVNRREILQRVARITGPNRRSGQDIAVLFCDIDNLKDINDTYGHAAGDEVLRTMAERITSLIRTDDVAARVGGDEMLVVLSGVHSLDEATAIAEKIRDAAHVSIGLDNGRVTSGLSIGVTLARTGETTDELVARADRAMYEAKRTGRNRVVTLPPSDR